MVRLVFIAVFLAGMFNTSLAGNTVFDIPTVKVYPNPFSSELKLDLHELGGTVDVVLTDLLGNIIVEKRMVTSEFVTLDLADKNLRAGIYILNLKTEEYAISKKLVKK